jgi:hypothetical protein
MDAKLQELERLARNTLSEDDITNWGHAIRRTFGERPAKKDIDVRYDEANQIYAPRFYSWSRSTIVPEKNKTFFDCLKFQSITIRRGGADVIMQSLLDNKRYYFSTRDFSKIVLHLINGVVSGWFTFVKRGNSIKLGLDSIVRLR